LKELTSDAPADTQQQQKMMCSVLVGKHLWTGDWDGVLTVWNPTVGLIKCESRSPCLANVRLLPCSTYTCTLSLSLSLSLSPTVCALCLRLCLQTMEKIARLKEQHQSAVASFVAIADREVWSGGESRDNMIICWKYTALSSRASTLLASSSRKSIALSSSRNL
jgi:hypothetical protein